MFCLVHRYHLNDDIDINNHAINTHYLHVICITKEIISRRKKITLDYPMKKKQ